MFIEIHHKIGRQNRVSLVNTDKIISINPYLELKCDIKNLSTYIGIDEIKKIPDNPLITDFPDDVVEIRRYDIDCDNDFSYEVSLEEFERIKKILQGGIL